MNATMKIMHGLKPIAGMVLVQIGFAGVNILYKLAENDGMNARVIIAYRFIFVAVFMTPIAFFAGRKTRPRLTWMVLGQAFLCGLLGGSLAQNLFMESLTLTTTTVASAMANLVPGITFILAVSFGLEKLALKTVPGGAKVIGTVLGIGGAMLLTFYKGVVLKLWSSHSLLQVKASNQSHAAHHVLGAFAAFSCYAFTAGWFIVQAKMSEKYPCPLSCSALNSIMAALQATIYGLCMERNWGEWRLGWNIRLLTVAYAGIVASGLCQTLITWCVRIKGPLYVSVFSPVMLIVVAVLGKLLLGEDFYLGSVLGAIIILAGLYVVLWGKAKEQKEKNVIHSVICV